MCISGSEIETPRSIWMQLRIYTNYTLAVNHDYMITYSKLLIIHQQLGHGYGESQWSVNDYWFRKEVNWEVICFLLFITNILAAMVGQRKSDTITAPCWKWESMECQWFLVLEVSYLGSSLIAVMHNQCIGWHYGQKRKQHGNIPILKMGVNRALTIFGLVSNLIGKWFARCYP